MRRLFLLALLAAPFSACDSETEVNPPSYAPAPVVTELITTFEDGSEGISLSAATIDSVLATAGSAPIATELLPLGFSFPTPNPTPGEEGPSASSVDVVSYPSPFSARLGIGLTLPESERAALYLLPAVVEEGSEPPSIRAGALVDTPDGFDGVLIAEGPSSPNTLFFEFDPQELGMDYGVYRVVAFSDGNRRAVDVLYAPCVDGRIAGLPLCR